MSEHVPFETSSIRTGLRVLASLIWAMAAAAMAFVMAPSQAPWETLLAVVLAGVAAYLWSHCGGLWPSLADCPLLLWPLAAFLVWRLLVAAREVVPELDATAVLGTLPAGLAARIHILAGLFVAVAVCWLLSWLWQGLRAYFATVDLFERADRWCGGFRDADAPGSDRPSAFGRVAAVRRHVLHIVAAVDARRRQRERQKGPGRSPKSIGMQQLSAKKDRKEDQQVLAPVMETEEFQPRQAGTAPSVGKRHCDHLLRSRIEPHEQ